MYCHGSSITVLTYASYFRPPKGAKKEEARKWTDVEKALLIQGIEKYGIGHFGEISKEYLTKWVSWYIVVKDQVN